MEVTIIIPHYKTGKMTAYSISQFLKYKGKHNVHIIVGDNHSGDGTTKYLEPFLNDITVVNYPTDLLQSHGILISYILSLGLVKTDYFITAESDSFPVSENWLYYIEDLIEQGYDAMGSILLLSGGRYLHPCGSTYKTSMVLECEEYCKSIPYSYFPNASARFGFDAHLMVHDRILDKFLDEPNDYIDLAKGYIGLSKEQFLAKRDYYKPTVCAFHNGMGNLNESVKTYGERNIENDVPNIMIDGKKAFIERVGYEPGQFLTYWMLANNKKVAEIPTETKWLPNREGQQQEWTLMGNGFKHIWGISSYVERSSEGVEDIYKAKRKQPETLYATLPPHLKIADHKKQLPKTFSHFGNTGDVIASLPCLKRYYELSGIKPILVLVKDHPAIYYEGATHPVVNQSGDYVSLNQTMIDLLTPLLKCQDYIEDVVCLHTDEYDANPSDLMLSEIRNTFCNIPFGDIRRWYFYVFPELATDLSVPYLTVPEPEHEIPKDKIVISRSERYRNPSIDYSFIKEYQDDCIFIGTYKEWLDFTQSYGLYIEKYNVKDFLEFAQILKHCRFHLTNQTMAAQISESIKVPRVIEICSYAPNVIPCGVHGYDFYSNQAVYEYFKWLNKIKFNS